MGTMAPPPPPTGRVSSAARVPRSSESLPRQAARASWIAPIVMLIVNVLLKQTMSEGGAAGALIMGGIDVLLLLVGIGAAVFALTQVGRVGRPGVLAPAVTGLVVSVAVLSLFAFGFVSGYRKGRDRREAKLHSQVFLNQVAGRLNRSLPMMIDQETELVSTVGLESTFVYNYRLVNSSASEIDAAKLNELLRPQVTNGACTNPETRDQFLKRGVRLRYLYTDKDRAFITSFDVTAADCAAGLAATPGH